MPAQTVPARIGDAAAGPAATTAGPAPARSRWRAWRGPLLVVLGLLLVAVVLARLAGPVQRGYLDPSAVDPSGSRALAALLEDAGVDVVRSESTTEVVAAADGATVLVTDPWLVTDALARKIMAAGPERIVLVGWVPGLASFGIPDGIGETYDSAPGDVPARCSYPAAERAGAATFDSLRYTVGEGRPGQGPIGCFGADDFGMVVVPGSPEIVLLSTGVPLINDALADSGNAALGMNLLGPTDRLLWWLPSPLDPELAESRSAGELLPDWVPLLLLQFVFAAVLAAYWRGRRLGPVVTEPLPVVVDATETTRGRGRLLQASRARDTAAEHLRARTVELVSGRLDLPPQADPRAVVDAVAGRTGRAAADVGALLFGPAPGSDEELVRMSEELADLVREVGR